MTTITPTQTRADDRRDFQDAIAIRLQAPIVDFDRDGRVVLGYGGRPRTRRPSNRAMALASGKITDLIETYYRTVGPDRLRKDLSNMSKPQLVALCFSRSKQRMYFDLPPDNRVFLSGGATGDLPNLLADSMGKALLSHFASGRRVWQTFAREGAIQDFRAAERIRLEDFSLLDETAPGEDTVFRSPKEAGTASEQLFAATYTGGLVFTRQAMLNDDLAGITAVVESMSAAVSRLEDRLAVGVLTTNANMSDGNALFSGAHDNTVTGALSATSIGAAIAKFATREDRSGNVLDLEPGVILTPSTLRATAQQEVAKLQSGGPDTAPSSRRLQVASSGILDADSTTAWYAFTNPADMAAVEVAFLTGQREPRFGDKSDFDNDALKVRVAHDVAAAAVDFRAAVRSSGA